jgi:UDP-N-acetylmuramoyl-tripeptide--D-alanyl-D-alanine ligase
MNPIPTLATAAEQIQGQYTGDDIPYFGVSTDTRTLQPGELYIALEGPTYNGHAYITQAAQAGAAGAIVSQAQDHYLPQIIVPNTRQALGALAAAWRAQTAATWIGITGSNGKTTLKTMVANILAQQHQVLATQGNFNNDIGLPQTLLRWQGEPYAVIEMGANHPGEIANLTQITQPQIAVLNNAGRAHLAGFGSLAGVAQAKAEIIQGLQPEGTFIYNADDAYAGLWKELAAQHPIHTCTFGIQQTADIRSTHYHNTWQADGFAATFDVQTAHQTLEISLQLAGEHNRLNALAAIAVAETLAIPATDIQAGLATMQPVPGRLKPQRSRTGAWIIDDSYNANADSVQAALQVLQTAPGRRTLVLGDMTETGQNSIAMHTEIGETAKQLGIERLYSVGEHSQYASEAFQGDTQHRADPEQMADLLRKNLQANDSLLIKGSRTARMEHIVQQLIT